MGETPESRMRGYLQRIATGPQLSKDLTADETQDAVAAILAGDIDPVQAGIFLIALRMKRETEEEYLGALEAIRERTLASVAGVDDLVDVADPYDGFARQLPASPFLPAVLAACGVPAVCHGARELAPKRGVSTHRVLAAAGLEVEATSVRAAERLADPAIGWAYVGVEHFCPSLHALTGLRDLIVKRPLLSTVEKLAGPVRARGRTHLVVGFVHKGYDLLLLELARAVGFDSALAIKGLEGGVVPSLSAATTARAFRGERDAIEVRLDPAELDIVADERAPALPEDAGDLDDVAAHAAAAGLAALEGAPGATRDALVHVGASILAHVGAAADRIAAAVHVRGVLDRGEALARLRG